MAPMVRLRLQPTGHPRRAALPLSRVAAGAGPGSGGRSGGRSGGEEDPRPLPDGAPPQPPLSVPPRRRRQADSSDPITTALTRRFGLAGGLAWAGFLAAGVVGEQVKTRLEGAAAARGTAPAAADAPPRDVGGGVLVQDVKIGGGGSPAPGLLAVLELAAWVVPPVSALGGGSSGGASALPRPQAVAAAAAAAGPPLVNTADTGKPLVLLVGGRPLTGGLCPGAEAALLGMRAGGEAVVVVPGPAAFPDGATLQPTRHAPDKGGIAIPAGADLVYRLKLVRVSVPPS